MREMGSPQLQLPVFGQKVVVKKRRWKREAWEAITQNATYVGPCPDMTFGLRVMDQASTRCRRSCRSRGTRRWTSRWWVSYGPGEGGCEESREMRIEAGGAEEEPILR